MKNWCLLALLILVIPIISADSLSPSQETDVNVVVDGDFPIINIVNPQNTTYSNNTVLEVNYTINEQTLDSIWYTYNNGTTNFSVIGNFNLSLNEGSYLLRIYANDSFNRTNYSEVYFSMSNTIPFCGDNVCNPIENCNACSQDCGACPPSGGGSGSGGSGGGSSGGSGSGEIIDFEFSPEKIVLKLKQGESKKEGIVITNNENKIVSFVLSFPNLEHLIQISERHFPLNPGESKLIPIEFITSQFTTPDLYINSIKIQANNFEKFIVTAIEVESSSSLFDINLEIPRKFIKISPGEEIISEVNIFNLGASEEVEIIYTIKNEQDEAIFIEKENIIVDSKENFLKSFQLPENVPFGDYVLYVQLNSESGSVNASYWFTIQSKINPYIIFMVLAIILFILVNIKRLQRAVKSFKKNK